MSSIAFRDILIDTASDDQEGRLILSEGRLVGVLVCLQADEQADRRGHWSLEAGFGPLDGAKPDPFTDLDAVRVWVHAMTGARARRPEIANAPVVSDDEVPLRAGF